MKSIWDQIVDGGCPWDSENQCPLDCHKGEDYCPEFRRIREVGYRKDDFDKLLRLVQEKIMKGECPMYGGKCPDECYRDDEINDKYISEENKRCDEYKYAHGIITIPKHWADVGK